MKLITLNIWAGNIRLPLLEFIKSHAEIDIFCLQEVYNAAPYKISTDDKIPGLNIFSEIHDVLPKHQAFFKPLVQNFYGIGMLIKNDIEVLEESSIKIHENLAYKGRGPTHSRDLQWIKLKINNCIYTIMNVHGLWNGQGKTDSPERLAQSQEIRNFMDAQHTPMVLCGDFNLRADTKSIEILEKGMSNLIKNYNVQSTRTSLYDKDEKHADYIFVSPQITVKKFEVLDDLVSDHAPLLLEFE